MVDPFLSVVDRLQLWVIVRAYELESNYREYPKFKPSFCALHFPSSIAVGFTDKYRLFILSNRSPA